jgi:hypothetical protein
MTNAESKYIELYTEMAKLCAEQGWGDPFSYARSKEILTAITLGHTVSEALAGADGYNQNGEPVEYKSTTGRKPKGAYTGISVHQTWYDQAKYLQEEKILKYPEHYYSRYENGKIAEIWMMTGEKVYEVLMPKLHRKWMNTDLKRKDPRLSADVTWSEIQRHGRQVF